MTYYDEQLQKLQAQMARKQQLEAKVSDLRAQCSELSACVRELEAIKLEEEADVAKLEGRSLAAFFYNVIDVDGDGNVIIGIILKVVCIVIAVCLYYMVSRQRA